MTIHHPVFLSYFGVFREKVMIIDPIGQRFTNLVVVDRVYKANGHIYYTCLCDCGNTSTVTRNNLLKANTTCCVSCGHKKRASTQTTVGCRKNKYTYTSYIAMKSRCKENDRYKNIKICSRWLEPNGFLYFLEDMGPRPQNTTLDRIDNSLGYYKENCRWATSSFQNHNKTKRSSSAVSYIGVTRSKDKFQMQILKDGIKVSGLFDNAIDAAVYYDNISEELYGDRPNGTKYKPILPNKEKIGGLSYCKKSRKYRVRFTDVFNIRRTVGYFEQETEAMEVLDLLKLLHKS